MATTTTRARLRPCEVCDTADSKYKCPQCESATCSLACSKQHKSAQHGRAADSEQGVAAAAADGDTIQPLLPALQLGKDKVLQAPGAHRFTNISRFVPLNQYSDATMLEDFEYLQFLGRSVTSLGRDLIQKGWVKTSAAQDGAAGASTSRSAGGGVNGKPAHAAYRNERVPAEQRNRQQLERTIRKANVPIMLLPDGMSTRKENQTRWKAQTAQLQCTMQVTFPSSSSSETDRRARRAIVHHVPWTRSIADVVLAEINKRLRSAPGDSDESTTPWQALLGRDVAPPKDDGPLSMASISDRVALVVAVHSAALRNESSAKFLEWWQRQVRNGMVKADGLQLDEEKRAALEQARQGAWATIEGLQEEPHDQGWPDRLAASNGAGSSCVDSAPTIQSVLSPPSGLLSAALLSRMQTQRDAQRKEQEKSIADAADGQLHAVASEGSAPAKASAAPTAARSVLVLSGDESTERLLRGLPKGHAIVEYPHVEVWDKLKLLRLVAQGKMKRVSLDKCETGGGKRSATVVEEEEEEKQGEVAPEEPPVRATKKARMEQVPLQSALMGLSAYASSDDEDDEEEEAVEQESKEGVSGDEADDGREGFNGSLSALAQMLRANVEERTS